MSGMTNDELLQAELRARCLSHSTKVYTGNNVSQAVRSSMRAGHLGDEWMRLFGEVKRRGLAPLSIAIAAALSAGTPSTATHHALHEGRDVEAVAGMVDAPGTSSGEGVNK